MDGNSQFVADLEEIKSSFDFFDDWEDKYRFVIDLGRELPELPAADRVEANLVRGCQSQVWVVPKYEPDRDELHLAIDSDAHIVRGLIAIVLAALDGRSPKDIVAFDMESLFLDLDLLGHLSQARGNGLRAMVKRIKNIAQVHVNP